MDVSRVLIGLGFLNRTQQIRKYINAVLHPVEIACDSVALPLQYPLQMVCLALGHLRLLNEQELSLEILNEQPKDTKVHVHCKSSQKGYSERQ